MVNPGYRLRRSIEKTVPDWSALLTGAAPRFAYGGAVRTLPVFTYHDTGPDFVADLEYLRESGYRTVGAAEIEAAARGDWRPDDHTVAITIDDGLASVERVAVPALARHGFRAIVFVIAGLVPPTSAEGLMGWSELRRAARAGMIEVGSHSLHHHYVPTSPRIVGWVTPDTAVEPYARLPVPRLHGGRRPRLGEPILYGRPRYATWRAYRPEPDAFDRCHALAAAAGPALFAAPGWRRALEQLARVQGTWESKDQGRSAILEDMRASLEIVGRECPNPAARHLCYPWSAGGAEIDRLAAEAGAVALYGNSWMRPRPVTTAAPAAVRRLSQDLVRRLPGRGRASFAAVLRRRVGRTMVPEGGWRNSFVGGARPDQRA